MHWRHLTQKAWGATCKISLTLARSRAHHRTFFLSFVYTSKSGKKKTATNNNYISCICHLLNRVFEFTIARRWCDCFCLYGFVCVSFEMKCLCAHLQPTDGHRVYKWRRTTTTTTTTTTKIAKWLNKFSSNLHTFHTVATNKRYSSQTWNKQSWLRDNKLNK